jgi:hypothetical protein
MNKFAFWLVVLAFVFDKIIQSTNYSPKWVNNYLDDFLLIPIFLGSALMVQQAIVFDQFSFKKGQIFAVWLVFSILFEFIFPKITSAYVADVWDILAYGLGAIYFKVFLNYPAKKASS